MPQKYRDIQFVKKTTLLGQQITLNTNTTCATQEWINKAKCAWEAIKYRAFLDNGINVAIRIQLWNTAIYSILKYGLCTLKISESVIIKLQQFCSKCIRDIAETNENKQHNNTEQNETSEEWERKHKTNKQIRGENNLPATESKIYSEKLCSIYRWETTDANTFLNNQDEFSADLSHVGTLCIRLKDINQGKMNNNVLNESEQKRWDDFITHHKKDEKTTTKNYIGKIDIPLNLNKITYPNFKNSAKSVYTYDTTYPERRERRTNDTLQCPTCGKECYSKSWLTIHRKSNENCMGEYYAELENLKICTNIGCGKIPPTHSDRGNISNTIAEGATMSKTTTAMMESLIGEPLMASVYPIVTNDSSMTWLYLTP